MNWYRAALIAVAIGAIALASSQTATGQDPDTATTLDEMAESRLRRTLAEVDGFGGLTVQLSRGVVTLSGRASDEAERREAIAIAQGQPGVNTVLDRMTLPAVTAKSASGQIQRRIQWVQNNWLTLVLALLIVGIAWILSRIAGRLPGPLKRLGVSPLMGSVVARLLKGAIFVVGLVWAFDILGITAMVGALVGTAGVLGLAIGFAFKDIVENYLAGILMSARRPFELGEWIKVGTEEGKVMRMTTRELILMSGDGNHIRIPNSHVFRSTVWNFSRNPMRRFKIAIEVSTNENLTRVKELGAELLANMEGVESDPAPYVRISQLGASSVPMEFFGWVNQKNVSFDKSRSEAIRILKAGLEAAGVIMPDPVYSVRMLDTPLSAEGSKVKPIQDMDRQVDVAPDYEIEKQILLDQQTSPEDNLLGEMSEGNKDD